jgi:hypothetical protein
LLIGVEPNDAKGQIAVKIASRMAIAGNRYNMIVRRLRDASLFSYVDSHSSSLHTGGSALSGIGAQHTEQCRCAATPEELVDRLLLPRSRAAVSLACEAVRVAALAILSFLPKGITLPLRFQQSSHGMILLLLRLLL